MSLQGYLNSLPHRSWSGYEARRAELNLWRSYREIAVLEGLRDLFEYADAAIRAMTEDDHGV